MKSVVCVRERAAAFCRQRNWERFHVPVSLAIALAGECGEVCEIFQWKETMLANMREGIAVLTDAEVQHVGEEISDVFIYSTRLCDVCGIDLGHSIDCVLNDTPMTALAQNTGGASWRDISFDAIYAHKNFPVDEFESQRQVALQLQAEVGKMSACFAGRSETLHAKGLGAWTPAEKLQLSSIMGSICLLLCVLAKITGLSIGQVIADKFEKNERKYPVALAKGSSAKYTAYASKDNKMAFGWKFQLVALVALAGLAGFAAGRHCRF
eukprot:gene25681-31014_t